ncbi:MAG: DNA gyrase subunit A [Phototrophicaceae bacterium]
MSISDSIVMEIGTVRAVNINEEMRGSYLDYAMSVIVARALPDARDGLKPVHRRILFAMHDMGLRPNTSYKKSARIVGEVLGKYHPHGDSAVYDAMARMAQDFSLRYMLVAGQGNFGSVDGDRPAAMRYTEARLASITEEILVDINMNTVDFVDNYDGQQQEPLVLPARLPNLLLNGASGIAVGMATNIPPHNLKEIVQAEKYLIDNYHRMDEITVDELLQFVTGPDFPTGAQVLAGDELKEAYATGRGKIVLRGRVEIEEDKNESYRLVFTEIPYQIGKSTIVERIATLVREGRLEGIRDLRDESDRQGMRLVIELKRGAQPRMVLNRLYKYTQLQSTFGIQMLALVKGEPRTISLKRALFIHIEHRYEVIVRRSEFELSKLRARAHILEGLLKALSSLDAVIQTIRNAKDTETARLNLINRFELSEAQANAILDMQLRRLAALEQVKLRDEYQEVMVRITYLEDLLSSPEKIRALIRQDLQEIEETYGDRRRTEIVYGVSTDFDEADLVRKENVIITITANGYIKRVPAREYRSQRRGGKGVIGMTTHDEDTLDQIIHSGSKDYILFFTDRGKVYCERAYQIPETGRAAKGTRIQAILQMEMEEHVTAVLPITDFEREGYFVLATVGGRVKRVHLKEFADVRPSGLIALRLDEGDRLGWVKYTDGDQDILMATALGQSIRFNEQDVRVMGRTAGGVSGIRLDQKDEVISMDAIKPEDTHILVISEQGYGKLSLIEDYPLQKRYGGGVKTMATSSKTGPVSAVRCVNVEDDVMLITEQGTVIRSSIGRIRESSRNTKGVTIMNVSDGDRIVSVAIVTREDEDDDGGDLELVSTSNGDQPDEASMDVESEE